MLDGKHREAEKLAAQAAAAVSEGNQQKAIDLYARAAELEEQALQSVPEDKPRTLSILSVSLAALLYKAQLFDRAEITIFRLLGSESLQAWANSQLRDLLSVVADERLLATQLHSRYSGESITVALRGGEIGVGTAPLDLILEKVSGFRSLLYRFAEWLGNYPLRRAGNPSKALMDLVQARATEPVSGSYQLEIRLTEPLQPHLFQPSPFQPKDLSDAMFEFFKHLTVGDLQQLEEFVPQADYRKALLQLTRNVAPRGRRVKEVGIYRKRRERLDTVYLTEALPTRIRAAIPKELEHPGDEMIERRGVLRALHLDKKWLELSLPKGEHERCFTLPDMLDDVVGPMVNQEVVVRGPKRRRGRAERLLVREIQLADED